MRLLEYAEYDFTQYPTVPGMPAMPIVQAPPAKKGRMSHSRRQFWLHFALVCFFLFMEIGAFVAWSVVTNDALLPPFNVEKVPTVVPCAHVRIYFNPTQSTQQSYTDESCP